MENLKKISWNDITVSQLIKINNIDKNLEEDEQELQVLSIVYGIPLEDILEQSLLKTKEMLVSIADLHKEPKPSLIRGKYEINGHRYKLFTRLNNFTTAQYIDFKIFAENYKEHLPQFLSIFFIPEDCKTYNEDYDIEQVQLDMKDLKAVDALAVAAFFLTLYALSIRRTLRSSIRGLRKGMDRKEWKELKRKIRGLERTMFGLNT